MRQADSQEIKCVPDSWIYKSPIKHDWYWADIKFREPQLIQVKPKIGSLMRLLSVGLNEQLAFPPKLHYIHFWNTQGKGTIPKSAGIETAIKELKDVFCNSFKRK